MKTREEQSWSPNRDDGTKSKVNLPDGVWLGQGSEVALCRGPLSGHRWKSVIPKRFASFDSFSVLCLTTNEEGVDHVWLCRENGELFNFDATAKKLNSVPAYPSAEKVRSSSFLHASLESIAVLLIPSDLERLVGIDW